MNMPNSLFMALIDKKIKQNIKEQEEDEKNKSKNNESSSSVPPIDPNLMEEELNEILEGGR